MKARDVIAATIIANINISGLLTTSPGTLAGKILAELEAWAADEAKKRRSSPEADAWEYGFEAGHQTARTLNPEWPKLPTNPYRE